MCNFFITSKILSLKFGEFFLWLPGGRKLVVTTVDLFLLSFASPQNLTSCQSSL